MIGRKSQSGRLHVVNWFILITANERASLDEVEE